MSLRWIVRIFVHRPFVLLVTIAIISILSIIIPFYNKTFPNFSDPTMGFETRGTTIAQRVTAWKNFYEETQPSGSLTGNPHEYLTYFNQTKNNVKETGVIGHRRRKPPKNAGKRKKVPQTHGKIITQERNVTKSTDKWMQLHKLLSNVSTDNKFMRMDQEKFFCGPPDDNYVQFVLKSDTNLDLFTVDSLLKICRIETELTNIELYTNLCLEDEKWVLNCCRPWSLPNYVALLNNRPNCLALTEKDVTDTRQILKSCRKYYDSELLDPICQDSRDCMQVPIECRQFNAVFIIFNYLTTISFLADSSVSSELETLTETIIFLPMARSVATLPFYNVIERTQLGYDGVSVVAMEFGAKNELFDEILIRDTRLMIFGGCFVIFCMWTYTCSLFLTAMTIIAIGFALGISYFIYVYVYNLQFFPFMNLLAAVVIIGIGADDAFIFCKMWHTMKTTNNSADDLQQIMSSTLYHALISMFVTSITTAIAFLASYLSSITAIRCFGIFSGTAIMMNYLLMVTWLPCCVVVWEKYPVQCQISAINNVWKRLTKVIWKSCWHHPEKHLVEFIIRFKYFAAIFFTIVAVAGSVIVFYYPKLQIQRTNELQLFETQHLFEQYDLVYKNKFAFKTSKIEDPAYLHYPLRFIWGILPIDNGDYLNPKLSGKLTFDDTFNISDPASQQWMQQFCAALKRTGLYQPTQGAFLTNCFIETFIAWMNRSCIDPFDSDINRYPCCNESTFPYDADVFDTCIIDAQNDLHQTPPAYLMPNKAGLQFTKSETPTLVALVIEYDSNYTYLAPYSQVDEFIEKVETWMAGQMVSAPEGLRNGFFASDLEFFDLQRALPQNTILAVSISMSLALVVLFLATLNITGSLLAIFTITCSIITIMAMLVLLGWKLNILESVAISSTIGFTVDYCLHYAVNYKLTPNIGKNREAATTLALTRMLGPTTMGAITTGAAGAFMMLSDILAYKQIGQFLVIVTSVSWIFATFHLGSLLAIAGPENDFGQFHYSNLGGMILRKWQQRNNQRAVFATADPNEVESLAVRYDNSGNKGDDDLATNQGGKDSVKQNAISDGLNNQSPSNSAITFITTEDN